MLTMNCYQDNPLISPQAFQDLIKERTVDKKRKAEEKRQDGFRRIADMNSKTGVNPLDLFPKEIWLKIFNEVDLTPQDRFNFWGTHPQFHEILKSNKVDHVRDILFPLAVGHVLDHVKNETEGYQYRKEIPGFPLTPFLKLRQVCKSLRLAVNHWFQEKLEEQLHQRSYKPEFWNPVPTMTFYLHRDQERLNGLIENYGSMKGSFFLRSMKVVISLTYPSPSPHDDFPEIAPRRPRRNLLNRFPPFKSALVKLLELVGDQILRFHLFIDSFDYFSKIGVTVADHYLMLQECCQLMPNLERLDVTLTLEDEDEGSTVKEASRVPRNLKNLIETRPFPTLRKLERISLEQDKDISSTVGIYNAILKANTHVKMLKLEMEDSLLRTMSLSALRSLKLEYFSWENNAYLISPRAFDYISGMNWPLKSLKIVVKSKKLNDFIKSLNGIPTLEMLTLALVDVEIGKGNEFLILPNLTHLDFKFHGNIDYDRDDANFLFSLQFLVHSRKLERIRWTYMKKTEHSDVDEPLLKYLEKHECPEKMIDFRAGRRDLESSNIWRVFPELDMVEVEIPKVYADYGNMEPCYRPGKIKLCGKCHSYRILEWLKDEVLDPDPREQYLASFRTKEK